MACSISHASKPAAHLIQATPLASDGWRFGVVAKAYGAGRAAAGKQAKCSAPSTRREEAEPAAASTALVPIDRTHAVDLQVIDEKPAEIIERFFLEVVRPSFNRRAQSVAVWSAYTQWCSDRVLSVAYFKTGGTPVVLNHRCMIYHKDDSS